MNLFALLNRGAAHAGVLARREIDNAAERARADWLNTLRVDETRAWLGLGDAEPEVLNGFVVVLGLAAMAHGFDGGRDDHPGLRVVRGAMSAIRQCGVAGSRLDAGTVRSLSAAAAHARAMIERASHGAIVRAAQAMHALPDA